MRCNSFSIAGVLTHYPELQSLAIRLCEIGANSILHTKRKYEHYDRDFDGQIPRLEVDRSDKVNNEGYM